MELKKVTIEDVLNEFFKTSAQTITNFNLVIVCATEKIKIAKLKGQDTSEVEYCIELAETFLKQFELREKQIKEAVSFLKKIDTYSEEVKVSSIYNLITVNTQRSLEDLILSKHVIGTIREYNSK